MQRKPGSIRNKLMVGTALVAAAVLATPAAMARGYHGGDRSGDVIGALVVGAVIGGVIASASQRDSGYYDGGYYPAPAYYPPQGYYESYPPQGYYQSYPAYAYGDSGYYGNPGYGYGSSVNVGVVYSSGGGRWRGNDHRYDNRGSGRQDRRGQYYRHDGH